MSHRLLSFTAVPALAFLLLANRGAVETYDLRIQVEEGQAFTAAIQATGMLELGEASLTADGQDLPGDFLVDVEFSTTAESEVEVVRAEEGEPKALKVKFTENSSSASGEYSAMGTSDSFEQSSDPTNVGHTVLIEEDEDGEISVTDVSDDDSLEPLSEEDMESYNLENPFALILPRDPVEVGESWNIGSSAFEFLLEAMEEDSSDSELEEIERTFSLFDDVSDVEFLGTLDAVDGSTASLSWSLTFTMDQLDLVNLVDEMGVDAGLDELPLDSFEMLASSKCELEGKGTFDLESHHLTEFNLEGEYSFGFEVDASGQGSQVEASAEFEGTLEISGGMIPE